MDLRAYPSLESMVSKSGMVSSFSPTATGTFLRARSSSTTVTQGPPLKCTAISTARTALTSTKAARWSLPEWGRFSGTCDRRLESHADWCPSNGMRPNNTPSTLPFVPTTVRFVKDSPMSLMSLGWTFRLTWTEAYITTNGGTAEYLAGNVTRGGTLSMVKYQGYW